VIGTLPHALNPLWLANVPVRTGALFQAVRDTLWTLLADPKYLGAQPGMIAALHTWSQTLGLHPHGHCLVTGGGLRPTGQWVAVRNGFLLPARVVMAVFRGKMVAALRQRVARGALVLPEPMRPQQWLNLLPRLGHPTTTKWNVRIMERYRHGAGVVTYLARYLRGGPITHARRVAWEGDRVTLRYRTSAAKTAAGTLAGSRMTWSSADFLQRWLRHVPAPQTRTVRAYGLYHHTTRRRWGTAGRRGGSRPWSSRSSSIGRRPVSSGATRTRNGVRPAGSASCAWRSSRVGEHRHPHGLGSMRHEVHTAGRHRPRG
jgi:hypothetical protein